MTAQDFLNQWNEVTLLKLFEIPVTDKRTNESDYIIFDIEIEDNKFIAQHVALNQKESDSKFVATIAIDLDYDFSIDRNLEELYDACITEIIDSEFYKLAE